jgi:hypothetical protein
MTTKTTAMTNTPHPSPYTGDNPSLPETADELRARIPGWGADLTPVFGTSCPPKGLSGKIRRLAHAHHPLDPLVVLGPRVLAGAAGVALARRVAGRRTST